MAKDKRTGPQLRGTSGLGPDVRYPVRITTGHATGMDDRPLRPRYPQGKSASDLDKFTELFKQSPALAVAQNILGTIGRDEPSLADRFVASTYQTARMLDLTAHETKLVEPTMIRYREDMRKAHRFVLDTDFIRLSTEISSQIPAEKLLARLQYASLPYERTWIEFDLKTKVRTMRRIHGYDDSSFDFTQVGNRLGLLFYRINDTDAICQLVAELDDREGVVPTLLCYFFSLRERAWNRQDGREWGCRPNMMLAEDQYNKFAAEAVELVGLAEEDKEDVYRSVSQRLTAGTLWGYSTAGAPSMVEKVTDLKHLGVPSFLERHGQSGYGRMWEPMWQLSEARKPGGGEGMVRVLMREVVEFTGMMRWITVVLAMLNEVPTYANLVKPQGSIRTNLTTKKPFMDYHRVTLRLPKTNPLPWIERHFRHTDRKHRAHEVRAFWRTYLHETHCKADEHDWVYDHDNGYALCGKCEAFRRYIHEHIRGDEKLGWVRKDYVVKKEGQ